MSDGRPLGLRVNFSWAFAGNGIFAASQWGVILALTRRGSPEIAGQYALGLAIATPVLALTNVQLRELLTTDAGEAHPFHDYLLLRILGTLLGAGAVIFACFVVPSIGATAAVIMALTLARAADSLSDVHYGLFQRRERLDLLARSLTLRGVAGVVAVVALLHLGLVQACLGLAAAWALVLILFDAPMGRRLSKATDWSLKRAGKICGHAIPLGITTLLLTLNSSVPRLFIDWFHGTAALGIFAAVAAPAAAGTLVMGALAQATSSRLARHYAELDFKAFWRILRKLLLVAALLGGAGVAIAALFGRPILTLLYGSRYGEDVSTFAALMAATGITYVASVFGYAATAVRQIHGQPVVLVLVAVVTLVSSRLLIPPLGSLGAACAMGASGLSLALGNAFLLRRAFVGIRA